MEEKNIESRLRALSQMTTKCEESEIKISLEDFYPSFRGKKVDLPNFQNGQLEEIAFLIGNKKNEDFKLLINKIELK